METVYQLNVQATDWEKIIDYCTSERGLLSRIYKKQ